MLRAENGALLYSVQNVVNWVKQGTAFYIGGSFITIPGQPSQQLQASTNTTLGYYNGQMLATSAGDGTGLFAGQVAGALINFDPASTDTGQAVWNSFVIADPDIKFPFPLVNPVDGVPYVFPGILLIATPVTGWILREQFMYGPGTPATDVTIVQTAITTYLAAKSGTQSQCMNSSNAYETVLAY